MNSKVFSRKLEEENMEEERQHPLLHYKKNNLWPNIKRMTNFFEGVKFQLIKAKN